MTRFGSVALAGAALLALASPALAHKYWVFLGTSGGKSEGIYRCDFDTQSGKLSTPELAAKAVSPSFVAIHPTHKFLYAVAEVDGFEPGKRTGGVVAFSLDTKTGALKQLNAQPSKGGGPCHIVVDKAGKNVLLANYGGGSATVVPIKEDGSLGAPSGFQQHTGMSVNPGRQKGPHAHSINLDPANKFAFVADLGLDKVLVYKFDGEKGTIEPNDPAHCATAPGAGPRHFAFHPSGKYAYVINEMDSTLQAMSYDGGKGELTKIQTISTLPAEHKGNSTAEVVVHPSGKFVYGSNRGHDSIAVFKVDEATGKLTAAGHQGKDVKTPRNFNVDPSGRWLIVGNQGSDSVVVFKIDQATGALEATDVKVNAPKPICIRFAPVEK